MQIPATPQLSNFHCYVFLAGLLTLDTGCSLEGLLTALPFWGAVHGHCNRLDC